MTQDATPGSLCILRLSALGDATHVLPLLRRIQAAWPQCRISWVIGKGEARLLQGLDGVEFIVFDKREGLRGLREFRERMRGRHFDVLLQMQLALRANLLSACIPAARRIGYDGARSKELHGWFVNERIPAGGHHVLDAFQRFLEPLSIAPGPIEWGMPIDHPAFVWAGEQWPDDGKPCLLISPCSSHAQRNWHADGYAALARHAHERGWRVVLCGGRSEIERRMADAILSRSHEVLDLVGKDTLPQLIALLERADLVASPDSGPVHIANAVGTPVLGLYACTDATRSGPYSDLRWTVNRYPDAALRFMGRPAAKLRWGQRVEKPGVMDLISVEEVLAKFDAFERWRREAQQA